MGLKLSRQTSTFGGVFFVSKPLWGNEEQTELHKLRFYPENHEAYSDNLPVVAMAQSAS